ncbi:unnamed protein product [Heterobilharzia americana]|nr:unnamed protein product [Heterobilharzia americana]
MLTDLFGESGMHQGCYTGDWVDDIIEGYGRVEFSSGSCYEGGFKENKMDGFGTYYWASGHILKAYFEQNYIKQDSLIELIDPDGRQWIGRFKGKHQEQQLQSNFQQTGELNEELEFVGDYLTELPFSAFSLTDLEGISSEFEEVSHSLSNFIGTNGTCNSVKNEKIGVKEDKRIIKDGTMIQKSKHELEVIEDNLNQIVLADTFDKKLNPIRNEIRRNIEKFLKLNNSDSSKYRDKVKNDKFNCPIRTKKGDMENFQSESVFRNERNNQCLINGKRERDDRINKLLEQDPEVYSSMHSQDCQLNESEIQQNTSFTQTLFNPFNNKSIQSNKNFIKRNIELAARWKDVMPMTAEEEARIEELLADHDEGGDCTNNNDGKDFIPNTNSNKTEPSVNGSDELFFISNLSSTSDLHRMIWPYLNAHKTNKSCVQKPLSNEDQQNSLDKDDHHIRNEENSANQLALKENCYQLNSQALGILSRLTEINAQLEKFQRQRQIDDEKSFDLQSFGKSAQIENKVSEDGIRPGERCLVTYHESRELNERLNEIDTQLAKIQQTNFEELSVIMFIIAYTKLWSNSSSNIEQLECDLNALALSDR